MSYLVKSWKTMSVTFGFRSDSQFYRTINCQLKLNVDVINYLQCLMSTSIKRPPKLKLPCKALSTLNRKWVWLFIACASIRWFVLSQFILSAPRWVEMFVHSLALKIYKLLIEFTRTDPFSTLLRLSTEPRRIWIKVGI